MKRRVFVNSPPLAVMSDGQPVAGLVHSYRVADDLTELRRVAWQHPTVLGAAVAAWAG